MMLVRKRIEGRHRAPLGEVVKHKQLGYGHILENDGICAVVRFEDGSEKSVPCSELSAASHRRSARDDGSVPDPDEDARNK
jgi:hypothetical protein